VVWLSLPLGEEGGKEKNGAQSLLIFQRVPSGGPDSPAEQEAQHRRQDHLRLTGQFGRGRAGHGMGDQCEGVVVGAMRLRSGLAVELGDVGSKTTFCIAQHGGFRGVKWQKWLPLS